MITIENTYIGSHVNVVIDVFMVQGIVLGLHHQQRQRDFVDIEGGAVREILIAIRVPIQGSARKCIKFTKFRT
jgi:hypothetical protein